MAKGFKKNNPLDQLEDKIPVVKVLSQEEPVVAVELKSPTKVQLPKEKRKVGRPKVKTEDTKTINIAIPVSVLEQMEIAKLKYCDNLTKYVNHIIRKDLEANGKMYQEIYDMLIQQ